MTIVIESPVLGSIDVEQGDIYSFPHGIPGFEANRRFVIVQPEAGSPFAYLQSLDSPELVLLVANPFLFFPKYDIELPDSVVVELGIEAHEDVVLWCIVTIPDRIDAATMNLLAPIAVNISAKTGRQTILTNTPYTTKHKLFDANQAQPGGDADAGAHA